jgi:hypothetical protein
MLSSPVQSRRDSTYDLCPICFDSYRPEVQQTALKCGHVFHQACLNEAVSRKPECPVCRISIELPEEKFLKEMWDLVPESDKIFISAVLSNDLEERNIKISDLTVTNDPNIILACAKLRGRSFIDLFFGAMRTNTVLDQSSQFMRALIDQHGWEMMIYDQTDLKSSPAYIRELIEKYGLVVLEHGYAALRNRDFLHELLLSYNEREVLNKIQNTGAGLDRTTIKHLIQIRGIDILPRVANSYLLNDQAFMLSIIQAHGKAARAHVGPELRKKGSFWIAVAFS